MKLKKILQKSTYFELTQFVKPNGKYVYGIRHNFWLTIDNNWEEVKEMINPGHVRSSSGGSSFRYSNRKEAEEMYLLLIMKWS